jgi:hypothetical protein
LADSGLGAAKTCQAPLPDAGPTPIPDSGGTPTPTPDAGSDAQNDAPSSD